MVCPAGQIAFSCPKACFGWQCQSESPAHFIAKQTGQAGRRSNHSPCQPDKGAEDPCMWLETRPVLRSQPIVRGSFSTSPGPSGSGSCFRGETVSRGPAGQSWETPRAKTERQGMNWRTSPKFRNKCSPARLGQRERKEHIPLGTQDATASFCALKPAGNICS